MIEAYAFLAAFTVQILVMSVLLPAWFIRYVRAQAARFPAERLAQLYPGVDVGHAQERFLTQYRALTTGIAVLGLLLLGWLFSYMRRPDWDEGPVEVLVTVYFLAAQMLPLVSLSGSESGSTRSTSARCRRGSGQPSCSAADCSISSRRSSFSWPS